MGSHVGCSVIPGGIPPGIPPEKGGIGGISPYIFTWVLIVFPLRVINKLIKLSLFEQVTVDEFAKIRRQYQAFTLDKINNSGELTGISKLSI